MNSEPKWIKSGGGPLICIERALAKCWLGVHGNSSTVGSDLIHGNDYDRACNVADYVGKVPVAGQHALILGDMPLETLIWRPPMQLPRIVRVYYADADVDVTKKLESAREIDFSNPAEAVTIDIASAPLLVFDSAYAGSEVGGAHLTLELPLGAYSVLTLPVSPDDRTSLLVHKFVLTQ